MGLATTVARRSLLQRPGRTLFSLLGIALGIATVVAVVVLDHNTIVGLTGALREGGSPDIELRAVQGVTELDEIEGVSLAARYFQADASVSTKPAGTEGRDDRRRASLVAIDAELAPQLGVYRLADGSDLPVSEATGQRAVLIGTKLAEKLDATIGDPLWISRPRRPGKSVCEDGQLVETLAPEVAPLELEFVVCGVLTREQLGRQGSGMVVMVDFDLGERLYAGVHIDRRWWARRDPGVDVERLKSTLARTHSYELNKAAVLGQAADERAFRTGVNMAGLMALLLGLYVIFHTLSMSLTERMREVGTLHALGTTRSQVSRIFLLEAVALAGSGAALGLVGGLALAKVLLRLGITTLGVGKHVQVFLVPWEVVLPLAGLGFLIALVGSVYPLVALGGTSSVGALRGDAALRDTRLGLRFHLFYALILGLILPGAYFVVVPIVGEATTELVMVLLSVIGVLGLLGMMAMVLPGLLSAASALLIRPFVAFFPFAAHLAVRTIRSSSSRIGVSAASLALVTAGLVGLKGMTRSLEGEVEVWAAEAVQDKVWVRDMPPTEFEALSKHLHTYPGVLGVEKGNARVHAPFLIMGVEVSELAEYGPCKDEPSLLRALSRRQGMILSRRLAKDLAYEVGDPIHLARANGVVETFHVVAISDAYGHYPFPDERMYGLIADDHMEAFYCVDTKTVTEVAVRMTADADLGVVEAAVFDFHKGPHRIHFRTGKEVLDDHIYDIRRDFTLFDILILLTASLAGLGVLNGQLLSALERTKEIGVLSALGVTRRQVTGMVLLESAAVGLVGGGLGVLLGVAGVPLVVGSLERIAGLTLPLDGAGPWAWVGFLGAVIVALLASLYPIWRMNRTDAVRSVRTG